MFEEDTLADFEGEVLSCHKFILAARSPVFYAMLSNDMKEAKQGFADVADFDSKIMREVLRYIYSNQVEELKEIASELILAAEKYEVNGLKEICIDSLIENMSTKKVVKSLLLSNRVSFAENLFNECIDFLVM
jgi:speckle-type POZ protein